MLVGGRSATWRWPTPPTIAADGVQRALRHDLVAVSDETIADYPRVPASRSRRWRSRRWPGRAGPGRWARPGRTSDDASSWPSQIGWGMAGPLHRRPSCAATPPCSPTSRSRPGADSGAADRATWAAHRRGSGPMCARRRDGRVASTDVALRKILGVETEFGIIVRGAGESNPIAASSVLINAYVHELARAERGLARQRPRSAGTSRTSTPTSTPAGFTAEGTMAPEVETHLVNAVLTNGARYYVDHAHPELSTPECADPRQRGRLRQGGRADPAAVDAGGARRCCPTGRRSSSTRTTPTARATATAATRTT